MLADMAIHGTCRWLGTSGLSRSFR